MVKNPPARAGDPSELQRSSAGRTWQPTPVFLPGESYGQRRLNTTEWLSAHSMSSGVDPGVELWDFLF